MRCKDCRVDMQPHAGPRPHERVCRCPSCGRSVTLADAGYLAPISPPPQGTNTVPARQTGRLLEGVLRPLFLPAIGPEYEPWRVMMDHRLRRAASDARARRRAHRRACARPQVRWTRVAA